MKSLLSYLKKYLFLAILASGFMIAEVYFDLYQPRMMQQIVDHGILGLNNNGVPDLNLVVSTGIRMLLVVIVLYRRDHLNKLTLLAALLAAVAVQCLGIEGLQALAKGSGVHLVWSPYVLAPCVFISLVLFFINANRSVREEVRRRVHF